ncbi:MAG: hypothetical protein R3E75_05785 [Steroidobacteraceae bacterium]|nr:hypothetical protein [Nevskiaceae bacterium]
MIDAAFVHRPLALLGLLAAGLLAAGCVVKETKPLPKIAAVQATQQIPEDELLDVAIHEFDPGLPQDIGDEDALAQRRIYPDVRKAEARLLPATLRATLESTGQWGAVRVAPQSVQFVDLIVDGRILVSTGTELSLAITARDAAGRVWIKDKVYRGPADIGSYRTEAALRARDPFQNVYAQIANDLVAARSKLAPAERREIRRIAALRFAEDLAPEAFAGYLRKGERDLVQLLRLPAAGDPLLERVERIRERDTAVIDTVDGYNSNFAEKLQDSYGGWRRTSFDAIEKEDRARSQARTRSALGAAAVLASIFVPGNCAANDYDCRRIESAARTAGAVGGTAAVLSGIKKFSDAKVAAQEVRELATSFQNEAAPQVVELEGRTLKLTGTAEEQYREWRRLLAEIYREEAGGTATPLEPVATPGAATAQEPPTAPAAPP